MVPSTGEVEIGATALGNSTRINVAIVNTRCLPIAIVMESDGKMEKPLVMQAFAGQSY